MSNDTIPTPVANGTPAEARTKPITDGETLVAVTAGHFRIDIKRRTVFFVISMLTALSGGAFWKSFRTDDDVSAVQDKVQVVEGRAEVAKATALEAATVVEEAYQDTRQKLDPTGQQIAELRADVDNLRAELEKERAARAGRRARKVQPKPVPVAVTAPLPPTAAAAVTADPPTEATPGVAP